MEGSVPTPASKLRTFVLHCGYADENGRLEPYDMGEILEDVPNGLLSTYSTNMQGGEEGMGDTCVPVITWSRCVKDRIWPEDDQQLNYYCSWGEHMFFDPVCLGSRQIQKRLLP